MSAVPQQQLSRHWISRMLEQIWQRTADVPEEELEADITQALEQLRQELLEERRLSQSRPNAATH